MNIVIDIMLGKVQPSSYPGNADVTSDGKVMPLSELSPNAIFKTTKLTGAVASVAIIREREQDD